MSRSSNRIMSIRRIEEPGDDRVARWFGAHGYAARQDEWFSDFLASVFDARSAGED